MPTLNDYILAISRLAGNSNYVLLREGENLTLPMSTRAAAEYLYNGTKPAPKVMPSEKTAELWDKAYTTSVNEAVDEEAKAEKLKLDTEAYIHALLSGLTGGVSDFFLQKNGNNGDNIVKAALTGALPKAGSKLFWPLAIGSALWSYYANTHEPPTIWHDSADNTDYSGYTSSNEVSTTASPQPNNEEPKDDKPDDEKKGRVKKAIDALRGKNETSTNTLSSTNKLSSLNKLKEKPILGYPARHPYKTGAGLIGAGYLLLKPIKRYLIPAAHNFDQAISEDNPVYVPYGRLSTSVIDSKTKAEIDSLNQVIDALKVLNTAPKKEEPDSLTNLLIGI